MGVTAKDVGILIWKVLKFTFKALYYCASKYPFIFCVLLLLFFFYIFLPSVFTFLIYFSPFVVFAGVVHRVFLEIDRRKILRISKETEKKNDEISSRNLKYVENELAVDTNVGFSAGTRARRRNVKEGTIKEDNAFSSADDKDNGMVDKSALAEENPKEIWEVKVDNVIAKVECSSSRPEIGDGNSEGYQKFANGKGETEKEKESSDDTEDDEEDEEQEERNKAVEWTEDDQKNLMDLGFSEIERNKRLESLIARRRSRKYMSLQGRRTMGSENFNAQIFSLQIPKTNPFLEDSSGNQFSSVPGSAPSVLLPNSNPFDIPYDPFEEKPNLTGGSFQQEFMVPNQKDMVFCRHESFQMSAFFPPDSKNDKHELMHHDFFTKQRVFERPPLPTPDAEQDGKRSQQDFRPVVAASMLKDDADSSQGKEDGGASEQVADSVDHENEDDESDVQTKEMVVDASSSSDTNSSSSFEASEPIFRPNKEAILNSIRQLSRRHIVVDRDTCQTNNNEPYDSGSSEFEKTKSERVFNTNMGMYHTPSHSIASDLQVEVSEIGSPPLTNISSQDEVSSTNDGDMEKEITSGGSEETWGPSSQVLPEKVVEQDTIDSHLLSPSKPELTEAIQDCKTNSNQSVLEKDLSAKASDSLEVSSSEALAVSVPENANTLTGELVATPSDYIDSVKPEESSSPKNLERELKTSDTVSDPEIPVKNDKEALRTEVDENKGNLSNLPNETNTMSTESGAKMENQLEHEHCIDSSKPHKEEDISTSLEHLEKEVHKLVQHKDVFEVLESTGNIEKPNQDREVESILSESGMSEVSLGLVESAASILQNEVSIDQISTANLEQGSADGGASHSSGGDHIASAVEIEQVHTEASLSSPKSVLQLTFSNDQVSSPSLGEEIYTGVPRSESGTGETDLLQQMQCDSLPAPAPEDAAPVSDISRDGSSHEGDSIKLEDSVHPLVRTPEEVNRTSISKESAAEEEKYKGESQITSMLEATAELLRPGNETDPKDTESMIEQIAETISPDPQSLPADQIDYNTFPSTRQEEQSNPPPEWSTDELTINPTAYDSGSEMGENGSKSVAGESECPSESITRQEEQSNHPPPDWSTDELTINPTAYDSDSTEIGENGSKSIGGESECPSESITRQNSVHHFSRNSEDFIEDLFSSLVGRSANASASVTRQSSAHEFSRSSEDFLQDLFKSLVSDAGAGGASTRVSRQGSLSESTDEMVQDMFKSLQDNPRA